MIWPGTKTVYTPWGYRPITLLSTSWIQQANGNWSADDRGTAQDVYESAISFKGPESELSELETILANNRENFSITCGGGEEVFGADIDYSSALDVSVIKYGDISRISKAQYSMPMRLRLFSPSFTGSASIADLRLQSFRYKPNSDFSITKNFTLNGSATYIDEETDPGFFEAEFLQTHDEMKAIRRYLTTTARTAAISYPSFGVSKPFGQRVGAYSGNVKIIKWEDLGRRNYINWGLRLTMVRVFT